jgi:cellulose synthase/poly-beta-1,6-N-acetylglucosamine synthase-like glycosyltransferase
MEVLQVFGFILALLAAVPVAIFCLEVLVGCWPARRTAEARGESARPRLAVIVPAHNEETGIAATLRSIQQQLQPRDRLLVIADNCSDTTATVARERQALVFERCDEMRRGKGFALAYGLDQLHVDPPDVVVFLDADCRLEADALTHLARAAHYQQRPVQALYLCHATVDRHARQVLSALAFRFRNLIRTLGLNRLGGPCHLTGSGMALPWWLVDKVAWATGNVVEDMQLGIDYTLAGYPPVFVPSAVVASDLPAGDSAQRAQRRRWEHGFLSTALTQAPRLAREAAARGSWPLALLALDMLVPPLALLALALVAGSLLALGLWLVGFGWLPLAVAATAVSAFAGATLIGWSVHCRREVPLSAFLAVPAYVLAKVPLYLEFLVRREKQWVRTERSSASGR